MSGFEQRFGFEFNGNDSGNDDRHLREADPQFEEQLLPFRPPVTEPLSIDIGRVHGATAADYQCAICHCLIEKAHAWPDSCQHMFCGGCVVNRPTIRCCPVCRAEPNPAHPKPLPLLVIDAQIARLKVSCVNAECHVALPCAKITEHVAVCPKAVVKCSDCNEEMPRGALSEHKSTECPDRLEECQGCREMVRAGDVAAHGFAVAPDGQSSSCAGMRPCPHGCTKEAHKRRKPNKDEEEEESKMSDAEPLVKVPLKFGATDLAHHLAEECPQREIVCKVCGETFVARESKAHWKKSREHSLAIHDKLEQLQQHAAAAAVVIAPVNDHRLLYEHYVSVQPSHLCNNLSVYDSHTIYDGDQPMEIAARTRNHQVRSQARIGFDLTLAVVYNVARVDRKVSYRFEAAIMRQAVGGEVQKWGYFSTTRASTTISSDFVTCSNRDTVRLGDMMRDHFDIGGDKNALGNHCLRLRLYRTD